MMIENSETVDATRRGYTFSVVIYNAKNLQVELPLVKGALTMENRKALERFGAEYILTGL